ncbi:hypothetical protein V6N13_148132 [Hibiscus sabdariffa]
MENSNPRSNLRCPHCAGPLSKEMIGSAVGGTTSAFYGFNHVMPIVGKYVKGAFPCWCGAVPALAQLASSSYHAAFSSSPLPPSLQDDKMHKSRTNSTL